MAGTSGYRWRTYHSSDRDATGAQTSALEPEENARPGDR
jgi:hypothetical protein